MLQHDVFDLEQSLVEVLITLAKGFEVPIAHTGQGIRCPFIGNEGGVRHEARRNRREGPQLLLQSVKEAGPHLSPCLVEGGVSSSRS
jgi:hypothetical protein